MSSKLGAFYVKKLQLYKGRPSEVDQDTQAIP